MGWCCRCPTGASRSSTTSCSQSGGYFTDRRDNEVIVNEAFARRHGIHPGQRIHLILNNRRQELFVVGTAISSEFVYLVAPGSIAPDPEHFGVFYLKRTFAEEVFDFGGAANQIVGTVGSDASQDRPQEMLRRIETMLAPYGVVTSYARRTQASNQFLERRDPRAGHLLHDHADRSFWPSRRWCSTC